jgi:hypothetical protein
MVKNYRWAKLTLGFVGGKQAGGAT